MQISPPRLIVPASAVLTMLSLRDVPGITSFPASLVWPLSVVDIVAALLQQADYQTARKYWNKLKERLRKEESESVTNCHQLKLEAADGKRHLTDVASPETILRIIQSVPSPKAEPRFIADFPDSR